jgi:hypothetical protein
MIVLNPYYCVVFDKVAHKSEFRSYEVIESYKTYKNVGSRLKLLISL